MLYYAFGFLGLALLLLALGFLGVAPGAAGLANFAFLLSLVFLAAKAVAEQNHHHHHHHRHLG